MLYQVSQVALLGIYDPRIYLRRGFWWPEMSVTWLLFSSSHKMSKFSALRCDSALNRRERSFNEQQWTTPEAGPWHYLSHMCFRYSSAWEDRGDSRQPVDGWTSGTIQNKHNVMLDLRTKNATQPSSPGGPSLYPWRTPRRGDLMEKRKRQNPGFWISFSYDDDVDDCVS